MLPQSRSSAWRVREMAIDEQTLEQLTLAVRRYVRERLVPIEEQIAEEDRIPDPVIQDFRDMGLFGPTTPEAKSAVNTSELQSLISIPYDVFCLEKKTQI